MTGERSCEWRRQLKMSATSTSLLLGKDKESAENIRDVCSWGLGVSFGWKFGIIGDKTHAMEKFWPK